MSDPLGYRDSPIPFLAGTIGIAPTVVSAPLMPTLLDATGLIIHISTAGEILAQI